MSGRQSDWTTVTAPQSGSTRVDDRRDEEALAVGAGSITQGRSAWERLSHQVGSQDVVQLDSMDHRFDAGCVDLVQHIDITQNRREVRGQRCDLGDVPVPEPDRECLGAQAGAMTIGTLPGQLVLTQEDADVLLVSLCLEGDEEREDSEVLAGLAMQQDFACFLCE